KFNESKAVRLFESAREQNPKPTPSPSPPPTPHPPKPPAPTTPAVVQEIKESVQRLLGEPYGIRSKNDAGKYCVYNTDTGEQVSGGCHPTHQEALAHQRALM